MKRTSLWEIRERVAIVVRAVKVNWKRMLLTDAPSVPMDVEEKKAMRANGTKVVRRRGRPSVT